MSSLIKRIHNRYLIKEKNRNPMDSGLAFSYIFSLTTITNIFIIHDTYIFIFSAITFEFSITILYLSSSSRKSNAFSISSVVLKYTGICSHGFVYPAFSITCALLTESSGRRKCTSEVATTGI